MFACFIRNAALYPRVAEYVGDTIDSLLNASAAALAGEWAYGIGGYSTYAAEAAIRNAYDKFGGADKVGKTFREPTGFLVEFDDASGKIKDYQCVKVEVGEGLFPLRIRCAGLYGGQFCWC